MPECRSQIDAVCDYADSDKIFPAFEAFTNDFEDRT
jgi:hypothetical protein